MPDKKSVLIFVDWFTPGFKAGGPIKSIQNLCDQLGPDIDFHVVTSDRDLEDEKPYVGIQTNKWNLLERAKVMYLSPDNLGYSRISGIIRENNWDGIYINGMFSLNFSIFPLLASVLNKKSNIIISPRGMLGAGALKIKSFKKNLFLKLMKSFGFYRRVKWHATSEAEAGEIRQEIGNDSEISIISNFPAEIEISRNESSQNTSDAINLVFISRISPKKNLDFAIRILKKIPEEIKLYFDIYGPIDDRQYWQKCEQLIESLPHNVKVAYRGEIHPSEVSRTFAHYDALFFPTRHENFGHAIVEALQAGIYVITSDQTPWNDLQIYDCGEALSFDREGEYVRAICSLGERNKLEQWKKNDKYLKERLNYEEMKKLYLQLFN